MYFLTHSFGGIALLCLFLALLFTFIKRALSCVLSLFFYVLEHGTNVLEHILRSTVRYVRTVLEHMWHSTCILVRLCCNMLLNSVLSHLRVWHATSENPQRELAGPSHSCGMPHFSDLFVRLFSLSILSQRNSLIEYPNLKKSPYGRV